MALVKAYKSMSVAFDGLSSTYQLIALSAGVFLFFGVHNYLQEAIMAVPGFDYGVMLGLMEVLGVAVCSFIERQYISQERGRVAPISAYPLLTILLLASSALSNMSLNYINFPTKVVFRSCKLIPTMMMASIIQRRVFTVTEYLCAVAMCTGLVLFAAADWTLTPSFHPIGLALVSLSVCADAILPNAQERVFRLGASRTEVTLYTNIFTLIVMVITTLISGDLVGAAQLTWTNRRLQYYFAIYTLIAYIAISMHMNIVKRFGGVAAVLVATGRKGMTLVLSFILFPKGFSWYYPMGAILVLGGILVNALVKSISKGPTNVSAANNSNNNGSNSTSSTQEKNSQRTTDDQHHLEIQPLIIAKEHLSDVESGQEDNSDQDEDDYHRSSSLPPSSSAGSDRHHRSTPGRSNSSSNNSAKSQTSLPQPDDDAEPERVFHSQQEHYRNKRTWLMSLFG